MQNPNYPPNPPTYSEAMHTTTVPILPGPGNYGGGIQDQSFAVPSHGFQQQGEFITTQPIATAPPPFNYGTMYPPTQPPPPQMKPQQQQPLPADTVHQTVIVRELITIGGCPACRIGVLDDNFTCCGICCAIFFFPVGILCCLCMKNKRCTNCGLEF